MGDVTARGRWLFWISLAMVFLLSVVPSWIFIEKAVAYFRFLSGFNPGTLRQLTVSYVPHRGEKSALESPEIRYAEFELTAPHAKNVQISGSFNQWQTSPLKLEGLNRWKILLPLPKGTYRYVFEVDGTRMLDPKSPEKAQLAGRECSVRQVR